MKEQQLYQIGGKIKSTFTKRGMPYTRKGYDVKVTTAEKFTKKCNYLGEPESRTVEKLIEAFLVASGWGAETRSAQFEPNINEHIREASQQTAKDSTWFGR